MLIEDQEMLIPVGKYWAKIWERDWEKVAGVRWYAHKAGRRIYANGRLANGKMGSLHRLILGAGPGEIVDHKNGDGLDNTPPNLRLASPAENSMNRRPGRWPKGVSPNAGRFLARISVRRRTPDERRLRGSFRSEVLAAMWYDIQARALFGEWAYVNFPESICRRDVPAFISGLNGRVFSVVFSRRTDGRERKMTCRTGVRSPSNGGCLAFDAKERNLLNVYDFSKRAYRFIPLERILCLSVNKTHYAVTGESPHN